MYSRNQGREQKRYGSSVGGYYTEVSDEEYEIYKYNLPPKYDGSRFRRSRRWEKDGYAEEQSSVCGRERETADQSDTFELTSGDCGGTDTAQTDITEAATGSLSVSDVSEGQIGCETGEDLCLREGPKNVFRHLKGIGYEELLLIALITAVAGSDEGRDALLLMVILLTQG